MKLKFFDRGDLGIFFRSFFITAVCIFCVALIYFGCCKAYEEIRQLCFNDQSSAVVLGTNYLKFFDFYYYFD